MEVRLLAGVWAVAVSTLISPGVRAEPVNEQAGTSPTALPGVGRVSSAGTFRLGLGLALSSGYGFTEKVLGDADGTHHRALGALAVSFRPVDSLALAIKLDGRFDSHSKDPQTMESDDGWVGDPRVLVRWARDVSESLQLGAQATAWLPGSDAPSVVGKAISGDVLLLTSVRPQGGNQAVHLNAGFRLDNSAKAVEMPDSLSPSDRLALGLSDSNAVLFGAGWEMVTPKVTVLAEASWDLLVGGDAPGPLESPLRVGAGLRVPLTRTLALQAMAEASASSRPEVADGEPLVPIEPRFGMVATLTYRPGDPALAIIAHRDEPPPPPPPPKPGRLSGAVKTGDEAPVAGAVVKIGDLEVVSAADGSFTVEELPGGLANVSVTAEGYKDASTSALVKPGETTRTSVLLERILPAGQVRGLVQSFGGQPLQATITIEPGGQRIESSTSGEFEIDLAPGSYTVTISAPGHVNQQRKVTVEQNGVTILNVDLRKQ
jgi:hypothetical protein